LESNVKIEKSDEHTLGEWEVDYEATCKAEGLRYKKCSVCKRKVETETIPVSTEHKYDVGACSLCSAIQPDSEGLEFKSLGDGTASVAGIGTCKDSSLVIPELTPAGERVVSIETAAFLHQTSVTSVVIPDSVVSFGTKPFQGSSLLRAKVPAAVVGAVKCDTLKSLTVVGTGEIPALAMADATTLESIVISDGVTAIGAEAFARCRDLTSVSMGADVQTVGDSAFIACSLLRSVRLGSGVVSIGSFAFSKCASITTLVIPASVKLIGSSAFLAHNKNGVNVSTLSSVIFETTDGWFATPDPADTSLGVSIGSAQLADRSEAALVLHTVYANNYLVRV
jgi:hypothetical protein